MVYKFEIERMRGNLEREIHALEKAAEGYPKGRLRAVQYNGKVKFYQETEIDGRQVRKGITRDPETVRLLNEKETVKRAICRLSRNAELLTKLLEKYDAAGADFPEGFKAGDLRLPAEPERARAIAMWAEANYAESSYRAEEKVHRTTRGLWVRSKSEALICEKLYEFGIAFRYEPIIPACGKTYTPDFQILRTDGKEYYWEHFGLMGNADYRAAYHRKLRDYEYAGIVPWDNLLVTYDDNLGGINLQAVESVIRDNLILPL